MPKLSLSRNELPQYGRDIDESSASLRRQLLDPVHRAAAAASGRPRRSGPASTPSSSGGRSSAAVPADTDVDAFVVAVENAGVQLVGLNFFAGDMAGGDRGLVSWPGRSAEFRDNIDVTVGIGERLGCKAFNALYGNRVDDASPQEQDELGRREPRARRQGRRSDRWHRARRAGQRGACLPAAHRGRCARGHRPRRRTEHRPAGRPLPPRRQWRRRRQGHRRPHRPHRARADRRCSGPQRTGHRLASAAARSSPISAPRDTTAGSASNTNHPARRRTASAGSKAKEDFI